MREWGPRIVSPTKISYRPPSFSFFEAMKLEDLGDQDSIYIEPPGEVSSATDGNTKEAKLIPATLARNSKRTRVPSAKLRSNEESGYSEQIFKTSRTANGKHELIGDFLPNFLSPDGISQSGIRNVVEASVELQNTLQSIQNDDNENKSGLDYIASITNAIAQAEKLATYDHANSATSGISALTSASSNGIGALLSVKKPPVKSHQSTWCKNVHCSKQPSFNFPGLTKRMFCATHKEAGMVNIVDRACGIDGCRTIPAYNHQGHTKGFFCAVHKEPGMVNVRDRSCEFPGCGKRPHFNFVGTKSGRFCAVHKVMSMINVAGRTCEGVQCNKRPHFNFPEQKSGRFCATHKLSGMVSTSAKRKFSNFETSVPLPMVPNHAQVKDIQP